LKVAYKDKKVRNTGIQCNVNQLFDTMIKHLFTTLFEGANR